MQDFESIVAQRIQDLNLSLVLLFKSEILNFIKWLLYI